MIWYRHWLELRMSMLIACAAVIYSVWRFHNAVTRGLEQVSGGDVPATLRAFDVFVPTMGPDAVLIWGSHAFNSLFLAALLPWMFAGDGLGASMSNIRPTDPSALFTMSLPLSRRRFVGTRLASGVLAALALFVVHLAVHASMLALLGHAVPLWWMALASLVAASLAAISIAVLSAFLSLVVENWVWWLAPIPALLVLLFPMAAGRRLLVRADDSVNIGLIGLTVMLLTAVTVLISALMKTREV